MPKFLMPFFRSGRGWYVQIGKEQIKLADGLKNSDTKSDAFKRYHELMAERGRDKPANSANPDSLTAVEVFGKFLSWPQKHNAPRTYEKKWQSIFQYDHLAAGTGPLSITRHVDFDRESTKGSYSERAVP